MNSNVKRVNKECASFPCHKSLEDCTFCFCPFYPCDDRELGKYVSSRKLNKRIWSCKECNWIHKKNVVDKIFCLIRENIQVKK